MDIRFAVFLLRKFAPIFFWEDGPGAKVAPKFLGGLVGVEWKKEVYGIEKHFLGGGEREVFWR